jgi:hypothetical protein
MQTDLKTSIFPQRQDGRIVLPVPWHPNVAKATAKDAHATHVPVERNTESVATLDQPAPSGTQNLNISRRSGSSNSRAPSSCSETGENPSDNPRDKGGTDTSE